MGTRIVDTNKLIDWWNRPPRPHSIAEAKARAREWHELNDDVIISPVRIEYLGGRNNRKDPDLALACLGCFKVIDRGIINRRDWEEAERIAKWVREPGRGRQLGDCLPQAIAKRLNGDIISSDTNIMGRIPQ